ncbi:class I SAM-dependent methyltransferase [Tolypothrix sp. PCC 7910]|uniref:class I SAM-dependent methyltransferase n=1 Tax=Tolypothrix sp. PCC 7910 TaxID=2099387 RepID=UPI0014277FAF|nr:class I SAM-dependent methyltransferase [Tolypothrix sp. PCC 7910]QIR39092.1 class I SAM-dependent methyltransferase [Tolypothrix sp. PCC 7910]
MTHTNWFNIWNNRNINGLNDHNSILEFLLAVDGYDTEYAKIEKQDWLNYLQKISNKLNINSQHSLLELGCGAGAFLYPFYQLGNPVVGIDFSEPLANIAFKIMPKANILIGDILEILKSDFYPQKKQYDFILCNTVFQYFPDYSYAEKVIDCILDLSKIGVGIFDIPDAAKKAQSINMRKNLMSELVFEKKYKDLEHLYYEKDWLESKFLAKKLNVTIENQDIPNFLNGLYRFNLFAIKSI